MNDLKRTSATINADHQYLAHLASFASLALPPFCFFAAFLASSSSIGALLTKGITSLYCSGMYIFKASGTWLGKLKKDHKLIITCTYRDPSLGLVLLQQDADDSGHGAHGGVQHVAILGAL